MKFERVLVVGAGQMGAGIAQVVAASGRRVSLHDSVPGAVERGLETMRRSLTRLAEKGGMDPDEVLARIEPVPAIVQAELMIEAVVEDAAVKEAIFRAADLVLPADAILASNTSSIPIASLAAVTKRPDRVIGMHFFNPVPLMKLVEVVRSPLTSPPAFEEAVAFATSLGKTPVRASDKTGFIVNRLLVPYLLDAIRALEEGVGSTADIDEGMKLGCGHPMGPLTLLDFVGLDTTYYIANIMFDEFREKRFAPPPLLKRMVQAGLHGKKTGKGFYDYSQEPPRPIAGLV